MCFEETRQVGTSFSEGQVPHCEDPPEAAVVASCEADEVLCSERRKRQE